MSGNLNFITKYIGDGKLKYDTNIKSSDTGSGSGPVTDSGGRRRRSSAVAKKRASARRGRSSAAKKRASARRRHRSRRHRAH